MLSEFAIVLETEKSDAHLHNAALALSNPSRCLQLSSQDKDFVSLILWYCGLTRLRLLSPQDFDHCDDAYRCR